LSIILGLLGWSQQDLTHKGLRGLRHQHGDGMGDVVWLEHFAGVFSGVGAEFGIR
jgi:hypothetical protein